jgi:hypothetical protein
MMALLIIPLIMMLAEPQGWWTFVGLGVFIIYVSIGIVKFDKATPKGSE